MQLLNTPVETASKGQKQSISEAPAIMSVVTGEEIRSLGYRSVAEALENVPGFYVLTDRVSPNVGVRGINGGLRAYSNIIKVMIDGQPVSFRPDSSNFLGPELIPMEVIERIEVVRGPASSMYGANAFLGVVNIITHPLDKGGDFGSLTVRGGGGTHDALSGGEAVAGLSRDGWGLLMAASGYHEDLSGTPLPASSPVLHGSPGFAQAESRNETSRPMNALVKARAKVGERLDLDLLGHFSRMSGYGEFLDFGPMSHENRIMVDNMFARLRADWMLAPTFSLTGSVALSHGRPDSEERLSSGEASTRPRRSLDYRGTDAMVEAHWALRDKDNLTVGFDSTSDDQQLMTVYAVDNVTGLATPVQDVQPRKTFTNTGVYAQYMVYPLEVLGLTMNVRSDKHNVYGTKNTYRAGLVYSFSETVHAKLLLGTSFKAPTPWQLYAQPLFGGEVVGNPALKPETAQTFEAEVSWNPVDTMTFSLNGYRTKVKDKMELAQRGDNQAPINAGLQDGHGVEGMATLGLGNNLIQGGFGWQKTDAHTPVPFGPEQVVPTAMYPSFNGFLAWRYLYRPGQSLGLEARRASARRATDSNISANLMTPYQLDAYTRAEAFWAGQWKLPSGAFRVQARVRNAFDRQIVEPGFAGVDVPQPGRQMILSLTYLF